MADIPKPLVARVTALLAGPFLLGQRALTLPFLPEGGTPPDTSPKESTLRLTVLPPEHAIKRRG